MCTVTLMDVLDARDRRKAQQQQMLTLYQRPLVSFTINMPGDIKDCPASRSAFDAGLKALKSVLKENRWNCHEMRIERKATGPLALLAISYAGAEEIKKALIELENSHPMGRLFDLDVLTVSGDILSRRQFNTPARQCLICDEDAVICAREQAHDIHQIRSRIDQIVAGSNHDLTHS